MTTYEALLAARAEVSHGWCKDRTLDSRGRVCAAGAVERVCGGLGHDYRDAVAALDAALIGEFVGWAAQAFNDHWATTKEDVLALFDRALAAAVPVADPAHVFVIAA